MNYIANGNYLENKNDRVKIQIIESNLKISEIE